MRWETPTIQEIAMSAEIGAYQDEFDREDPRFVVPAAEAEEQNGDE